MFSKSKDPVPPPPSMMANAASSAAAKRAPRGSAPSIISADLTVTGTLVSNGDIQIDGVVEGDVRSVGLVIGEKAEIRGEILAEDIVVRGRVLGRIRGRKVQLAATSHVEGDILHEAFSVESGAFFEGNCRHSDNPLGDEVRKPAPQPQIAAPQAAPIQNSFMPQPVNISNGGMQGTGLAGLAPLGNPAE